METANNNIADQVRERLAGVAEAFGDTPKEQAAREVLTNANAVGGATRADRLWIKAQAAEVTVIDGHALVGTLVADKNVTNSAPYRVLEVWTNGKAKLGRVAPDGSHAWEVHGATLETLGPWTTADSRRWVQSCAENAQRIQVAADDARGAALGYAEVLGVRY